jgi:predicted CXXCH cytochrome family protein
MDMGNWLKLSVVSLAAMAILAVVPHAANAGIAGSPHDFQTKGASSLCITCHAPHQQPNTPLLWNHQLSAQNFSWSDMTKTTGGTSLPTNLRTWSGPSKMCLSCHDGTVNVGTMYSATYTYTGAVAPTLTRTGGDLKGNHPVAVPYPNGAPNTYNGITTGTNVAVADYVANPTKVKLFLDSSVGSNNSGVECSSCHNAHDNANTFFLRDARATLCVNCHNK